MSIVVKQPDPNTRYLALVIVAIACICHTYRTGHATPQQPFQQETSMSRSQAQAAVLGSAVSGFVGVDKSRGDSISVIVVDR